MAFEIMASVAAIALATTVSVIATVPAVAMALATTVSVIATVPAAATVSATTARRRT